MASTVSMTQNPGDYNLAYGPNPVTLNNLTTGAQKYVLQVRTLGGDILADIRQTANTEGRAIFDIQNILQTYVHTSPINTEQLGLGNQSPANLQQSIQEVERYILRIGDETGGVVDLKSASYGPYGMIYHGQKVLTKVVLEAMTHLFHVLMYIVMVNHYLITHNILEVVN